MMSLHQNKPGESPTASTKVVFDGGHDFPKNIYFYVDRGYNDSNVEGFVGDTKFDNGVGGGNGDSV